MWAITVENRESLSTFVEDNIYISVEDQDELCHTGKMCLLKETFINNTSLTVRSNEIWLTYKGFLSGIDAEFIIFNFTRYKQQERLAKSIKRLFKSRYKKVVSI
jgi:hypothetical protein